MMKLAANASAMTNPRRPQRTSRALIENFFGSSLFTARHSDDGSAFRALYFQRATRSPQAAGAGVVHALDAHGRHDERTRHDRPRRVDVPRQAVLRQVPEE